MPVDYFGRGNLTQTAGTRIQALVPGRKGLLTYISFIEYKDAGTAHTITLMAKVSETTLTAAVAASGTVIPIAADPGTSATGTIAAADLVAVQLADGSWHGSAVSSVSSLNITLSTALPAGTGKNALSGARFIFYGAAGDSPHANNTFLSGTGSASVYFPNNNGGLPPGCLQKSYGSDEPIWLDSGNATNAGNLRCLMAFYQRPTS